MKGLKKKQRANKSPPEKACHVEKKPSGKPTPLTGKKPADARERTSRIEKTKRAGDLEKQGPDRPSVPEGKRRLKQMPVRQLERGEGKSSGMDNGDLLMRTLERGPRIGNLRVKSGGGKPDDSWGIREVGGTRWREKGFL